MEWGEEQMKSACTVVASLKLFPCCNDPLHQYYWFFHKTLPNEFSLIYII